MAQPTGHCIRLAGKLLEAVDILHKDYNNLMVTIEQFIEQFLSAVDFQEPVEVKSDTKLANLPEWDSLAALATIVLFDTEYGKVIVGEDLKKCVAVSDLYALLG